jgi:putative transposase
MVGAPVRREQARFAKLRGVSLRRACALLGTSRSGLAYESRLALADAPAVAKMRTMSRKHPRWGHRFIRVLLARVGMPMSRGRTLRLWRSAGLCLPRRRPRRRRGGIDTPRIVATRPNEVWALDFVFDWCASGKKLKCLTLVDEFTCRSHAIEVQTSLRGKHVVAVLERLVREHGTPRILRSDNGPEFISKVLFDFALAHGIEKVFIEPGKPWQNGRNESFNGKFRNECLSTEYFRSIEEARVVVEAWRRQYNEVRPHSRLDYLTPNEYTRRIRQPQPAPSASTFQ